MEEFIMDKIMAILYEATHSKIILLLIVLILMDTVFGTIRAIRERQFNSCVGIDGIIRKVSMMVAVLFLIVVDYILGINLIKWVPADVTKWLIIDQLGFAEFIGLICLANEVVSVLKNMTLCGLPAKGLWKRIREWLKKYTTELPDVVEEDGNDK